MHGTLHCKLLPHIANAGGQGLASTQCMHGRPLLQHETSKSMCHRLIESRLHAVCVLSGCSACMRTKVQDNLAWSAQNAGMTQPTCPFTLSKALKASFSVSFVLRYVNKVQITAAKEIMQVMLH